MACKLRPGPAMCSELGYVCAGPCEHARLGTRAIPTPPPVGWCLVQHSWSAGCKLRRGAAVRGVRRVAVVPDAARSVGVGRDFGGRTSRAAVVGTQPGFTALLSTSVHVRATA